MNTKTISVFLLLITVFLCPVHAAAAPADFENAPDLAGFRGIMWGADRSGIPGLALLNDDPIIHRYSRRNDQLQLGGVELESVIYNFYKGRFMGVSIETRGADEWNRLKAMMFDKFGPAPNISAKKSAEQYEWRAARSTTHLQFFKSNRLVKLWVVSAEFSGLGKKARQSRPAE